MENAETPKTLFAFGLNHRTAPVAVREKLYLHDSEIALLLREINKTLPECVILSTCNRTEFYGVSDKEVVDPGFYKNLLIDFKGARDVVRDEHFFTLISCAACQQMFNVATSIDSKVVGDSQILRQLRGAYKIAHESGSTGKVLNQLLQRSFKLGKSTFTETAIHHGAVSVSLAAVEFALGVFGSLAGRSVLVIGAGETARLTAEALMNKRIGNLLISNRTRSHAEQLLESLRKDPSLSSGVADFKDLTDLLSSVDIVISSTASDEPILFAKDFTGLSRKMLLIDLAVPRDIDTAVGENPFVVLKNIDDLHSIIDGNHEKRVSDLPKVKKLIMKEMVDFLTWYYSLPLMPDHEASGVQAERKAHDFLEIKEFLGRHISEIHKLAATATGNFGEDIQKHLSLIERLRSLKAKEFAADRI